MRRRGFLGFLAGLAVAPLALLKREPSGLIPWHTAERPVVNAIVSNGRDMVLWPSRPGYGEPTVLLRGLVPRRFRAQRPRSRTSAAADALHGAEMKLPKVRLEDAKRRARDGYYADTKPHHCDACSAKFRRRAALTIHVQEQHGRAR